MVIRKLRKFFDEIGLNAKPADEQNADEKVRLAACVLLLAIAHSDDDFSETEQDQVVDILKEDFDLSDDLTAEFMELAHQKKEESVDLWRFTNIINTNYSPRQKERVIETLWKVVYADERLDANEDNLIHRLSRMLNLSHKQLIDAKKKVIGWD